MTHHGGVRASVREVSQGAQHDHAEHDEAVLAFDLDQTAQLREKEVDLRRWRVSISWFVAPAEPQETHRHVKN